MQSRQLSFQQQDLIPDPSFERLIAESIIYNTSVIVALIPEGCNVSLSVIFRHLELFRGPSGGKSDPPSGHRPYESPLLGVSPELYYFVVEISRLGLENPSDDENSGNVKALASKYILWKGNSMLGLEGAESDFEANFILGIQLYVIAVELMLCTLGVFPVYQGAEISTYASNLIAQAMHIINQMGSYIESALNMDYYAWPLAIIGSASKGQEERVGTIRNKMDEISKKTRSRGVEVVRSLLENVWVSEVREGDGLEILLRMLRSRKY